ncbi:MAG: DUF624 domain-containing protein [Bifidobacterium scardovii]|uniref:YesL family protein n=1 Tax=Bifidobacterium scardovii TaxID=158787 RepID=UPI0029024946|nr:DUF624 domain-containing protein [Bifidobacterium scardovii]MDU2422240.1 DUF624 domain-containing protein [Bifidobacterium scardovii]
MSNMSRFFDQNNLFFRFMGVVGDLILLNLLTLLCCLPVITAGSSLTAMHAVLWRMVRHEETYVARDFLTRFRRDFRQATLSWLGFLLAGAIMAVDAWASPSLPGHLRLPMLAFLAIVGTALAALAQWYFPMLSRYENTIAGHVRNAASLAVGCFPRTLCMLAVLATFAAAYLMYFIQAVPFLVILGIALPEYCCAWIYDPVFRRLDGDVDARYRPVRGK